jgi:hypothetical protein
VERFSLILKSLPPDPPADLLAELRELGWENGELPALLVSDISGSEAKIRKGDLDILGAELDIVPQGTVFKQEAPKEEELKIEALEEFSLELSEELKPFQAIEEVSGGLLEAPIWEFSIDDVNTEQELPKPQTVSKAVEVSTLQLSLDDDEPIAPQIPERASITQSEPTSEQIPALTLVTPKVEAPVQTLSLSLQEPEIPPLKVAPPEVSPAISEPDPVKPPEPIDNTPTETNSDSLPAIQAESEEDGDADDWPEVDEDEEEIEEAAPLKAQSKIFLGGALLVFLGLLAYFFLMPSEPEGPKTDPSTLVNALLNEQEILIKEERKKQIAANAKKVELSTESIAGEFEAELSSGAIKGNIQFGRYRSGLLIESLNIKEAEAQKLAPLELGAGKIPRPWIKKFEIVIPELGSREPLGANYNFKSEARAYVEDPQGTLRVPCMIEINCEFKSTLNCSYEIKNKALDKKTPKPDAKTDKKLPAQLTIERNEGLGFLVVLNGNFSTKLDPVKIEPSGVGADSASVLPPIPEKPL